MTSRNLVDAYLAELAGAAATLPGGRGTELVAEVREHIETALGAEPTIDEAAVRNVLDRLGSPAEIVAAERDEGAPPRAAAAPHRSRLTPATVVMAGLAGIVVLLLAVMTGTLGPAAAVMALAVALMTPYVWIPLVLGLLALALRRDRVVHVAADEGRVARRRPSPSLVGLVAIIVLLLVALLAQGVGYMAMVAVLVLPILVLLLALEVLGRRSG